MKKGFTAFRLKCFCIGIMIAGMAAQTVAIGMEQAAPGQWSEKLNLVFYIGQVVYLAAFPVSAFLLVEAYKHTADKKKLLLRLLAVGILVEIPMDIASYGIKQIKLWGQNQNYFFTMAIGCLVLWAVEAIVRKAGQGTLKSNLLTLSVYLAATMGAIFLRTEQSSVGVLTIITLFLFYGNKMFSFVTVAALYLFFTNSTGRNVGLEYLPVLSVLLIWNYNGEQGRTGKAERIIFYLAFPAAYCIMRGLIQLL